MISRRGFLRGVLGAAGAYGLGGLFSARAAAPARAGNSPEKTLSLHNVHTGERLATRYCADGCYDENELSRINYILRCHYTNTVKPINPKVIDLLCDIKDRLAPDREITIISGYRSPEYNEYLRRLGRHVAAGSLHMTGLAIDFAIDGIGMGELCKGAKLFAAGGVGRYPEFVHIDVGRVRYW
jgi:uncharacterized protein YcbK (DUF882 family)